MPLEKSIDPSIHHQVKAVMKSLNIDQAQLGEKLDLTQVSVSKALNGGNEKLSSALWICWELNTVSAP